MITLTNPTLINSILGGTATVAFDVLRLSQITHTTEPEKVNAVVEITSTADPGMSALRGTLTIDSVSGALAIEVPQLDFRRQITITEAQKNFMAGLVNDAQDALEAGLITVNVVDGVQASG